MTTRAIIDLKGIARHCLFSGDPADTVRNTKGEHVPAASHGIAKFIEYYLKPLIFEHGISPIDVIVVKEGKDNNARRRAIFPEYKTKEKPDDWDEVKTAEKLKCMVAIERLMLMLGAIIMDAPFCEADDTIAYVVERTKGKKKLFTVDFDMLQLHREDLEIYVPTREAKGELVIKTNFEGYSFVDDPTDLSVTVVPPSLVILYKAIVGDTSDGFKGVPGMGEGKIRDIIMKYGVDSIDELLEWARTNKFDELRDTLLETPCKILQKLYEGREEFRKCYWLARLHPEWCEMEFQGQMVRPKYQKRVPSRAKVQEVLDANGLGFMIDDLDCVLPYQWLEDANTWPENKAQWFGEMQNGPIVAFDYETWDTVKHQPYQEARKGGYVDMLNSETTGASFCFGRNLQLSFYLPTLHRDTANVHNDEIMYVLDYMEKANLQTAAHNAAFEMTVSKQNFDFIFENDKLPHDTLIMASHVDENDEGGLKKLSKAKLNYEQINYSEVVPAGGDMRDVSGEEVLAYGADDSVVTAHLWVLFSFILECEKTDVFAKEVEPFFPQALLIPFIKGVPIDIGRLAELKEEDDQLFVETDIELRKILTEQCSEINEAGFKIIWPEIQDLQFATMKMKGKKSDAEILESLKAQSLETFEKCKYVPYVTPEIVRNKAAVTKAAQSLGLPPVRSLKGAKIRDWHAALMTQVETRGVVPTEGQMQFLELILQASSGPVDLEAYVKTQDVLTGEARESGDAFFALIESVYALDSDLWVGDELNVGSPLQMALLFYGKMGLPVLIRNEIKNEDGVRSVFDLPGAPSSNEIALRTWMAELPEDEWKFRVLELVLILRAIRTRRSLYYVPYPKWVSPIDGMIHPGLRNCGTVTRRPSGSSPNILQVSKIKDEGKMRSTFLPHTSATIWRRAA
jgi:DNA polymerase I-like protein with 3'-5' exonuclease and polymerase domains/5'-3' exonuclease